MFNWLFKSGGNLGKEKSLEEELFSKGLYNIREPVFAVIKATKDLSRWSLSFEGDKYYCYATFTDLLTLTVWQVDWKSDKLLSCPWMTAEEGEVLVKALRDLSNMLKIKQDYEERAKMCSLFCTHSPVKVKGPKYRRFAIIKNGQVAGVGYHFENNVQYYGKVCGERLEYIDDDWQQDECEVTL